jgi:hypothetical protein
MQLVPQLILTLSPSGEITAELPGNNGARRKLVLEEGLELTMIRDELYSQRAKILEELERRRVQEENERKARHTKVWETAARRKNQGVEFADKMFGRPKTFAKLPSKDESELITLLGI